MSAYREALAARASAQHQDARSSEEIARQTNM
jgi:hypothetical protein